MDPTEAQPAEGQGSESGGSPYDSYLQSVPEGVEDAARQWFADTSKGLDQKLQEAAQYRQTWEPYEQVGGLREYSPEQLNELLTWHQQVTADDEQFRNWLEIANKEAGLSQPQAEELADRQEAELSREEIAQMIAGAQMEATMPVQEQLEELRFERAADLAEQDIRAEIGGLEKEHGVQLTQEQRAMIYDLGMNHGLDEEGNPIPGAGSWVQYGFERLKALTNEAQAAFVKDKVAQPKPAMSTGGMERAQASKTFEEAAARHRERIAQERQF